ncbi:MAG TPA: serine/threonine-protein kinase, partial [Chroococcales cyanobacterium]
MDAKDKEKIMSRKGCITCGQEFDYEQAVCPDDGTILTPLNEEKLVGTVLADRYEVLEVIGGGGMGLVYKARHRLMNRVVAIKTLHRHLISSAETLKRFQLEAQAASCLSLPNILTIYDFGLTGEGQPYMVMDYLEGTSLSDVLDKDGHLPVDRFLGIFSQACAGLAHAHQKGVLHRDIKPSNIMLVHYGDQADFVKIVDFGIAKLLNQTDAGSKNLTKTGEVYGSPSFMSPEQCRGKELDSRSDIYAMGCVMYRSITGQNPHQGSDIIELLFKQVSEVPAPFDKVAPEFGLPEELERIIFKAIAKDPNQRYQTMNELKEALDGLKEKLNAKPQDGVKPLWKRPGTSADRPLHEALPDRSASDPAAADKLAAPQAVPYVSAPGDAKETARQSLTGAAAPTGPVPVSRAGQSQSAQLQQATPPLPPPSSQSGGSPSPPPHHNNGGHSHAQQRPEPGQKSSAEHKHTEGSNAAVRRSLSRAVNQQQRLMIGGIAVAVVGIFALVWVAARNSANPGPTDTVSNSSPSQSGSATPAPGTASGAEADSDKEPVASQTTASDSSGKVSVSAAAANGLSVVENLKAASHALDASDGAKAEAAALAAVAVADKDGRDPQNFSAGLTMLGRAYLTENKYSDAKRALLEASAIREKKFGRESKQNAEAMAYLGRALIGNQEYGEAERVLKDDLKITRKQFGEHRELAEVMIALGDAYNKQEKIDEARQQYADALKILSRASGKFDPELA